MIVKRFAHGGSGETVPRAASPKKRGTHRRRSPRVATFGSRWTGNAAGSRFPFFSPAGTNTSTTTHGTARFGGKVPDFF